MEELRTVTRIVMFLLFMAVVVPIAVIVSLVNRLVDDGAPLYYPPPVKGERIEGRRERIIKNLERLLRI